MARIDAHPGEQAAQDPIRLLAIRESPLSVDEIFRAVGDDAAGGTALFVGTVRNHDSLLRLVHTFGDRFGAASFASGWQVCVTALAQVLGGGPVDIERDTAGTLHEAYLARFGELTRGRVEETDGGGRRVRFERQLVRPAEVVWARLTGGAEPLTGSPVPPGFTAGKVPAGPVTDVRAPELLAYAWHPEGEVRWELGPGTGHGPRLVLTQTGPRDFDTEGALAVWRARVEELAAGLLDR